MKKLNLGCGKDIKPGYLNVDSVKLPGVDKICNLEKYPWPFRKDEFDEVLCDNVLEHLTSIPKPLEELWRITKQGGKIIIKVPIYPSIWAFTDPTHKSVYTYITFNYFRPNDGLNYYSKARFIIKRRDIVFHPFLRFLNLIVNAHQNIQKLYYLFFSFLVPANSLYVELQPVEKQ
jgi:predicted SAM-dependent methyltransferase